METMTSPENARPGSDNGSRVTEGTLFAFPSFLQAPIEIPELRC